MKTIRKKGISYKKFTSVFKNRSFDTHDRLFKSLIVCETDKGFFVYGRPSALGFIAYLLISPILVTVIIAIEGLKVLPDVIAELRDVFILKPFRVDELQKDKDSTNEILRLIGWIK